MNQKGDVAAGQAEGEHPHMKWVKKALDRSVCVETQLVSHQVRVKKKIQLQNMAKKIKVMLCDGVSFLSFFPPHFDGFSLVSSVALLLSWDTWLTCHSIAKRKMWKLKSFGSLRNVSRAGNQRLGGGGAGTPCMTPCL